MRVGVTGGTGDLGRAVVRRLLDGGHDVVASHLTTPPPADLLAAQWRVLDITDAAAVAAFTSGLDALVHTAYRSDAESLQTVIVRGSANVATAAAENSVRLIHLSTDAVFGDAVFGDAVFGDAAAGDAAVVERAAGCYTEADPVDPVTAYGAAKAEAERIVALACPGAAVVRPSLIWSSDHRDHQSTMVRDALSGERPMRFFTDEYRCPVRDQDVARAIDALLTNRLSGPLHVAGADRVSRDEFARLLATAMGLDPNAVIGTTQGPEGPPRPRDVALDSSYATRALQVALPGVRELLRT